MTCAICGLVKKRMPGKNQSILYWTRNGDIKLTIDIVPGICKECLESLSESTRQSIMTLYAPRIDDLT